MKKTRPRVPVSRRALIQRINRVLVKKDEQLCARRGVKEGFPRDWTDTGNYYIVNTSRNYLVKGHVDPEGLARELGALKPYERLTD